MSTLVYYGVVAAAGYLLYRYGAAQTPLDQNIEGSRFESLQLTSSTEGSKLTKMWGRNRVGGNIIWGSRLREVKTTYWTTSGGGKGGGGGGSTSTRTEYTYFVSFAIGICEGHEWVSLGRIWADGKLLDPAGKGYFSFYPGSESQVPDATIESLEGAGNVPAYRGLAYIVFRDFALEKYGNRIPQITLEMHVPTVLSYGAYPTLGEIILDICLRAGIGGSEVDLSDLSTAGTQILGFQSGNPSTARESLDTLAKAYFFDGYESGGKVKFSSRRDTAYSTVSIDDLVVSEDTQGTYSLTRTQESELPGIATVEFVDQNNEFQTGAAGGLRRLGNNLEVISEKFTLVMGSAQARSLSDTLIQEKWAARESAEFKLPPSYIGLDPADGVNITLGGRNFDLRVATIERGTDLSLKLSSHDPHIYAGATYTEAASPTEETLVAYGAPVLHFLDIPLVNGEEEKPWAPRVAAYQSPHPPILLVYQVDSGGEATRMGVPASVGVTDSTLARADPWVIDYINTVSVIVTDPNETLESVTETEMLNGANALALEVASGSWEIMQFQEATLTGLIAGKSIYTLAKLLRGQLGTETLIPSSVASGAAWVRLQSGLIYTLQITDSQKTMPLNYRYGPSDRYYVDDMYYTDATHTGQAVGLLPYAPTGIRKTPSGADLIFSWVRRTRFGGDDFEAIEVPLNEETEQYQLSIRNPVGPVTLRTINVTAPTYVYVAAEQAADGGTLGVYLIQVQQYSTSIGLGRIGEATI